MVHHYNIPYIGFSFKLSMLPAAAAIGFFMLFVSDKITLSWCW
jgi:hypothetical protein